MHTHQVLLFAYFYREICLYLSSTLLKNRGYLNRLKSTKRKQADPSVGEAAGELVLGDPSLLTRRGDLLDLARSRVYQEGYNFIKGKSRSKRFASPPQEIPKPTRAKISAEVREKKISALKEDIASFDEQLLFVTTNCVKRSQKKFSLL